VLASGRIGILWVIAAVSLACSGSGDPAESCALPLAGSYDVVEQVVDPAGCPEGVAYAPLSHFAVLDCGGGDFMVSVLGESGCLKGPGHLTTATAPNACCGRQVMTTEIERPTGSATWTAYYRVDAALDGDRLVLEFRGLSQPGVVPVGVSCRDDMGWVEAADDPSLCSRCERIIGHRVR
jgi:hypothetical protein